MNIYKYVISLEGSSRIDGFKKQKGAENFKIFDAIDGKYYSGQDFNRNGFRNLYGFDASDPVVGCAVSHYLVMRDFILNSSDDSDLLLVAEDDAIFSKNFEEVVEGVVKDISGLQVALLATPFSSADKKNFFSDDEYWFQQSLIGKKYLNKYKLARYDGTVWGAGLYVMTRDAACNYIKFVERCSGIHWVADAWDYFKDPANLDILVVKPSLASWVGDSGIQAHGFIEKNGYSNTKIGKIKELVGLRTRCKRARSVVAATLYNLYKILTYPR